MTKLSPTLFKPFLLVPVAALAVLAQMPTAQAISRVETLSKSCAAIKEQVAREGAVILRHPSLTTPGITLYDRYVANPNACLQGEVTRRASVPTRDVEACRVYICFRPDPRDDEFEFPTRY